MKVKSNNLFMVCMVVFAVSLFATAWLAVAQDGSVVQNGDFFSELVKKVSEIISGKPKAIVIVGTVVQMLIMLMKTPMMGGLFTSKSGLVKMIIVAVLALSGMAINSVISGSSLVQALTEGAFLAMLMGYVNEVIKHVKESKEKSVSPPTV